MRCAFRISYIGTHFQGSQIQPGARTVEGELIAACRRLALFSDWREAGFASAGRTDRGVHARGQVIAFTTNVPERAARTLNLQLPDDIQVTGFAMVGDGFHPRYDALSRTYRYCFAEQGLDPVPMQEVAALFPGWHDFSGFARVDHRDPSRHILAASVTTAEGLLWFEVTAESFLWHMVRGMATVLAAAGRHQLTPGDVAELLGGRSSRGIAPAPASGLVLWDVDTGIRFEPVPLPAEKALALSRLEGEMRVMAAISRILVAGPGEH